MGPSQAKGTWKQQITMKTPLHLSVVYICAYGEWRGQLRGLSYFTMYTSFLLGFLRTVYFPPHPAPFFVIKKWGKKKSTKSRQVGREPLVKLQVDFREETGFRATSMYPGGPGVVICGQSLPYTAFHIHQTLHRWCRRTLDLQPGNLCPVHGFIPFSFVIFGCVILTLGKK